MSVKAMHTAARRHLRDCLALFGRWEDASYVARLRGNLLNEPAPPGEPQIARELLREVERGTPSDFQTVEQLRSWLLRLADRDEGDLRWPAETVGKGDNIRVRYRERDADELAGARRERELFRAYLRDLTETDLERVAPLPYRHVLSDRQSARWRAKLAERWGAHPRDDYWFPLHGDPTPLDVIALQDLHFYLEVEPPDFRALFHQHGITRVFEFVENHIFEADYELEVELFAPRPSERFWTSRELDWVAYVSHEHSITFGGSWLVEGIKEIWPQWRERLYTGYEYAAEVDKASPAMYEAAYRSNRWFREDWRDFL